LAVHRSSHHRSPQHNRVYSLRDSPPLHQVTNLPWCLPRSLPTIRRCSQVLSLRHNLASSPAASLPRDPVLNRQ
jgi:hypothetical protein